MNVWIDLLINLLGWAGALAGLGAVEAQSLLKSIEGK